MIEITHKETNKRIDNLNLDSVLNVDSLKKVGDNIDNILLETWKEQPQYFVYDGGDGEIVYVRIKNVNVGSNNNTNLVQHASFSDTLTLDVVNNFSQKRELNWHNCYSFGNGVESNRIGDVFNKMTITPGVKVSTVFEEYKEEHRKYGLIYSGLYNSTSGVNNLNQFIQAEKITKDVNPIYGSIQKLHSRDTDLVTLCEDKCLRILANKDAVFNADGNPNLTATENVLGQTIPFSGEYGISTNPESFASENYRVYFTDKIRGSVMRLSKDGLTPISEHGMKDWFRDNLKLSSKLIGSYDDKKEQYNITLKNIFYTNNKIEVVTGSTGSTDQVTAEIGYDGMTGASARFSAPPIPIPTKPPLSGGSEGSGSLGSGSSGGSGGGGGGGY